MNISQHALNLYRGDTCAFDVLLHDDGGAPFDASTAQAAMLVVGSNGASITPQLTVDKHRIHILFPADLTAGITWRRGKYDLQLTFGDTVMTVLRGDIYMTEDVTP